MLSGAGEHLPGGDRGIKLVGEHCVALGVVAVEWFLDPGQLEAFELPSDSEGRNPIPLLVRVDHQPRRRSARRVPSPPDSGRSESRAVDDLPPPIPRPIAACALSMISSIEEDKKPPDVL